MIWLMMLFNSLGWSADDGFVGHISEFGGGDASYILFILEYN